MSLPDHADRDAQYTWDTGQIFETTDDWERAREALAVDVDDDDPPSTPIETPDEAISLVDSVADWFRRSQRLELYARLRDCVSDGTAASDRMRAQRDLSASVETAVSQRLDRVRRTDDDRLDQIEAELDERRMYFASLREQADRRHEPAIEAVVEQFAEQRSSADRIADAYGAVQARFDPGLEPGERSRFEWLTGALYRDAFHHYQYVLGAVGALAVRRQLRDGDLDPERYGAFLRSTGREDPLVLFERLGVDLTTSDPYERATATFEEYVPEWE